MIDAFVYLSLSFESTIHLAKGIWINWKQFHFKGLAEDSTISYISYMTFVKGCLLQNRNS